MASLDVAQVALTAGSWDAAGSAFRAAIEHDADPVAYEGLAQVGWWLDDAEVCLAAREAAYAGIASSRILLAPRARRRRWRGLPALRTGPSVALGWLGRAHELLASVEERPEHGWCAIREAELALAVHQDPVGAAECARRAADVGRRLQRTTSRSWDGAPGFALTQSGEVTSGMSLLDSAAAAATAGDVTDLMWMGKVLCWLIAACHHAGTSRAPRSGASRVEVICRERQLAPLLNVCRIQYASVQVAGGTCRWPSRS